MLALVKDKLNGEGKELQKIPFILVTKKTDYHRRFLQERQFKRSRENKGILQWT